jgi:hypothetical protein
LPIFWVFDYCSGVRNCSRLHPETYLDMHSGAHH